MNKKTLYGSEAREKILAGVKKIVDAVKVTLGSNGRNVVIAQGAVVDYGFHSLPLHITKDGVTVVRHFNVEEPLERVGVMVVKEACEATLSMCGDGTTTSAVLAGAIVENGVSLINAGANPIKIKKGIDSAVEYVVNELKKMAIQIGDDNEKIFQIATVSANNDAEIGRLIADAFKKIGNEGVIDIEESQGVTTEIKTADGFKIERGWLSPLFITNREKQICEFNDALILMYQNRINHHTQYEKAVMLAQQSGRPIVFICEDAVDEGLAVLVRNNFEQRIKCCVIKSPYMGDAKREFMEDLAVATGGKYISDSKGVGIKEIDMNYFGRAKKVIISKDETIIIGGMYKPKQLEDLTNELRMNLASEKDEVLKSEIEKRIARLTGGIAVIHVGGATETEMKEKKDRVDDAVRATKAAISEGVIVGGGTAFLKINKPELIKDSMENVGWDIVFSSLQKPFLQICENAGQQPQKLLLEVLQRELNFGYNADKDAIENLFENGIIDPIKVLRCALQNAASSAGMVLTAECMICDTI